MIEEKLQEVMAAKKQIVEGSLVIWNARLEALVRTGRFESALDAMTAAAEGNGGYGCPCPGNGCPPPLDGCTCGSGCGSLTTGRLGGNINPAAGGR